MDGQGKPRGAKEAYCFSSEPKHGPCRSPDKQTGVFSGDGLGPGSWHTGSSGIYCFLGAVGQRNEGATEPLAKRQQWSALLGGRPSWEHCAALRSFLFPTQRKQDVLNCLLHFCSTRRSNCVSRWHERVTGFPPWTTKTMCRSRVGLPLQEGAWLEIRL